VLSPKKLLNESLAVENTSKGEQHNKKTKALHWSKFATSTILTPTKAFL
jgi:hypothetical protein